MDNFLNEDEKKFYFDSIKEGKTKEDTILFIQKSRNIQKKQGYSNNKAPVSIADRIKRLGEKREFPTDEEIAKFERGIKESQKIKKFDNELNSKIKDLCITHKPTDLCRTSIFHTLPRKGREALQKKIIEKTYKTPWAKITYTGRLLSVDDEGVLLAIITTSMEKKAYEFIATYTGIQKTLGIKKTYSSNNERIKKSLQRLSTASFIVEMKEEDIWSVNHILKTSGNKSKLKITIDKDFYEMFMSKYTILSLTFRLKLKGDLTKLLYSFLSSHTSPKEYSVAILSTVLNINKDLKNLIQKKRAVEQLKKAFKELQDNKFLKFEYIKTRSVFKITYIMLKKERLLLN